MANKNLPNKVYAEYCNNAKLAERRYKFLKTMPKAMRPIDHEEVLKGWEQGRSLYYELLINIYK